SANVLLRVPGATVSVDPTPPTRPRHPLRKPRPLALAAPCPLPSTRRADSQQLRQVDRVERFESRQPRRSGVSRCARGACGAVGEKRVARPTWRRWVDAEAARGTRSPTRVAPPEATSAAAHPASKRTRSVAEKRRAPTHE